MGSITGNERPARTEKILVPLGHRPTAVRLSAAPLAQGRARLEGSLSIQQPGGAVSSQKGSRERWRRGIGETGKRRGGDGEQGGVRDHSWCCVALIASSRMRVSACRFNLRKVSDALSS